MDVCMVIEQRLEELGLEQKDLAIAAEVTESHIFQGRTQLALQIQIIGISEEAGDMASPFYFSTTLELTLRLRQQPLLAFPRLP